MKEQIAIDRIKHFQSENKSYYVAFSGGKDSIVMYDLVKRAEIKNCIIEYRNTTVDPPDLIYFIRETYPEVKIVNPKMTMWQLIVKNKIPPSRLARYCCKFLKEDAGNGHIVITGIRSEESSQRSKRKMFEPCMKQRDKYYLHPIIDWTEEEVWQYIKKHKLPYPKLYDEGWNRIGCVGCPMATKKHRQRELNTYPKIRDNYIRAFDKMVKARKVRDDNGKSWETGIDVYRWWIEDPEFENGQSEFIFMDNA